MMNKTNLGTIALVFLATCVGGVACRSRTPTPRTAEETQPAVLEKLTAPPVESPITFYVSPSGNDGADGSAARPWKTLEKAAVMVVPGTTVHVAAGDYWLGNVELKTEASGTASARIRYVSDARWGARLRSTKTGNSAVWWNKGDYVDIEGFDISGAGALGIYNEGSHTRIIANHVHHVAAAGCPENGGAGIHDGNFHASDDDVVGNWVHDIGDYNTLCPRVHGIYHANRGGHIYNNVAFHNQGFGIHLWHGATDVTISNNIVFANAYGGIFVGADSADFPRGHGRCDDTVVENNIVFRNGVRSDAHGYGIREDGAVGPGNQYINNLVYQNLPADMKLLAGNESGTQRADPQFVAYEPDGKGDYRLRSTSPACSRGWRHAACDVKTRALVPGE